MNNVYNTENGTIADFSGKDDTQDGLSATWTDKFEEDSTVSSEQLKNFISDNHDPKDLEAVFEVPVMVSAVLGSARMPVHQLLKLGRGAVIELDRRVGEAIDIYVNNLLIARGEVVMVEDKLGITMTEIIKSKSKI